jgi:glutamate-5-semialdehyde dehydrogenase
MPGGWRPCARSGKIAQLADPVGSVSAEWTRPNGLRIQRVRVPLGVIGIIYESRPNVTADAGALCLKAGNAAILRGGSESHRSNRAIHAALLAGLSKAGLPEAAIALVPTRERAAVGMMLAGLDGAIDVIVPRGGKSLVARVQDEARVPVFAHLEGIGHVFVEGSAELDMAKDIVLNAKMRRTGVCGAAETLLVDVAAAQSHLAPLVKMLLEAGCEVRKSGARLDPAFARPRADLHRVSRPIIAARAVDGVDAAIEHIAHHGSAHTEAIVTANSATAQRFARVDSAIVLVARLDAADGAEFGMGAEMASPRPLSRPRPIGLETPRPISTWCTARVGAARMKCRGRPRSSLN